MKIGMSKKNYLVMRGGWEMTLRSGATGVPKPGHKSQALDEPQMLESSLCEGERKLIRDTSKPIQSAKHAKVASTAFTLGSKSLFGVSNQSITLSLHRLHILSPVFLCTCAQKGRC